MQNPYPANNADITSHMRVWLGVHVGIRVFSFSFVPFQTKTREEYFVSAPVR